MVVVNENHQILHIFGDVGEYMRMPAGRATLNLIHLAQKELSVALGTALHKAAKEGQEVVYHNIRIRQESGTRDINLRVNPIRDKKSGINLFAVLFEPIPGRQAQAGAGDEVQEDGDAGNSYTVNEGARQQIKDLEQELLYNRENLQATIEELETSNEELQATNEELVAANEELQSTNEELQSVNEELYTVNAEYQNKIQELTDLNNDMDNLLLSTQIGTLFLDQDLRIRKFTPIIGEYMNILQQDVGRPVSHISHRMAYENLMVDAQEVIDTLKPIERKSEDDKGNSLLLRLAPYQTDGRPTQEGVVITFIDVSTLETTQDALKHERDLLALVADTTNSAITIVNKDGRITYANRRAEEMLGLSREQITNRTFNDPQWQITDETGNEISESELPFARIKHNGKPLEGLRHMVKLADGSHVLLSINARPMHDVNGTFAGMLAIMEEITEPLEDDHAGQ